MLLSDDGTVEVWAATEANERAPRFSPDGRWLAFLSDESGRDEVYIQPFPGPGPRTVVSTAGGREPVWSPDGTELYYREPGRPGLMAVSVQTEPELRVGAPLSLFEGRFEELSPLVGAAYYDVHPDGDRFVMVRRIPDPEGIRLVVDWMDELERLVPLD